MVTSTSGAEIHRASASSELKAFVKILVTNGMYMGVSKNRVPQNGWFTMKNPIKMDDLGYHYFRKHPYEYVIYSNNYTAWFFTKHISLFANKKIENNVLPKTFMCFFPMTLRMSKLKKKNAPLFSAVFFWSHRKRPDRSDIKLIDFGSLGSRQLFYLDLF